MDGQLLFLNSDQIEEGQENRQSLLHTRAVNVFWTEAQVGHSGLEHLDEVLDRPRLDLSVLDELVEHEYADFSHRYEVYFPVECRHDFELHRTSFVFSVVILTHFHRIDEVEAFRSALDLPDTGVP